MKTYNSDTLYCYDPVFGDFYDYQDKGAIFATAEHPKMFLKHLLPLADIVTQIFLSYLYLQIQTSPTIIN